MSSPVPFWLVKFRLRSSCQMSCTGYSCTSLSRPYQFSSLFWILIIPCLVPIFLHLQLTLMLLRQPQSRGIGRRCKIHQPKKIKQVIIFWYKTWIKKLSSTNYNYTSCNLSIPCGLLTTTVHCSSDCQYLRVLDRQVHDHKEEAKYFLL